MCFQNQLGPVLYRKHRKEIIRKENEPYTFPNVHQTYVESSIPIIRSDFFTWLNKAYT